jgi:uncharacterized protein YjbI with pentapeptide repeats
MRDREALAILLDGGPRWNQFRHDNPKLRSFDLSGADLGGLDLNHADLRNVDLSSANLSRTNLSHTDLRGARLSRSSLQLASLRATRFDDADLSSANLSRCSAKVPPYFGGALAYSASFRRAVLNDANLTFSEFDNVVLENAQLRRANFTGATLSNVAVAGADLRGAVFGGTRVLALDLSPAIALDSISHGAPSHLDIETFRRSRGQIPVQFLKGCGLAAFEIFMVQLFNPALASEEVIDAVYGMVDVRDMQPLHLNPVFISYSHHDRDFVAALSDRMDDVGIRFWLDVHNLRAGRLEHQIDRAIRLNPTVILVLSEHSVKSDWVESEATTARELEKSLQRDVLCPITLDGSWRASPWPEVLRRQIEKYHILDFSQWRDAQVFERQWQKLTEGLRLFY